MENGRSPVFVRYKDFIVEGVMTPGKTQKVSLTIKVISLDPNKSSVTMSTR